MAVLPSADSSFGPCWVNCASASCEEKSSRAEIRTDALNNLDHASEIGQSRAVIGGAPGSTNRMARRRTGDYRGSYMQNIVRSDHLRSQR
jgi:hypothetical protein